VFLFHFTEHFVSIVGAIRKLRPLRGLYRVAAPEALPQPGLPLLNKTPLVFFSSHFIVSLLIIIENVPSFLE
jgi:hypothetical protein